MGEEFKELYEIIDSKERDLWNLLNKAVGRKFKFVNKEGDTFEIYIEYFRGFDKIGVTHYSGRNSEYFDEWDITDFYEIIRESVEIE